MRLSKASLAWLPATFDVIAVAVPAGNGAASSSLARPSWAKAHGMTMMVDSVLLGGLPEVRRALPAWQVAKRGRPALMIGVAARELAPVKRVRKLVVVGLGHNSLWDRNRVGYAASAKRFDTEAERLLRMLRRRGAQQFVWVTLRHCTHANSPRSGSFQVEHYCWYFPYVNERLRRLAAKHGDLVLADWTAVSEGRGLTYDAIHTTTQGSKVMARTIKRTIEHEAARQQHANNNR